MMPLPQAPQQRVFDQSTMQQLPRRDSFSHHTAGALIACLQSIVDYDTASNVISRVCVVNANMYRQQ